MDNQSLISTIYEDKIETSYYGTRKFFCEKKKPITNIKKMFR